MDTGQRLVDRMPINPKIAVFESTQERYVDLINSGPMIICDNDD